MPFKFNEPRRHRIPKAKYRARNWPDYDRGLVRRGDIRLWFSDEAIAGWRAECRTTPGGQRRLSNLAVETTLMLGALCRFPLRQTEGFVRSLMALMKVNLIAPDHTTLARRRRTVEIHEYRWPRKGPVDIVIDSTGLKFFGAGEWARAKHGETRRSWRKLHLSVDPAGNEIIAHELTDDDTSDPAMIGHLVGNSGGNIRSVIADDAYDGEPVYRAIRAVRPPRSPPKIIIPPGSSRSPAKVSHMAEASVNVMQRRLLGTVASPGSGEMDTANAPWSKPQSAVSRNSTTDVSLLALLALNRTRSPSS